MTEPILDNFCYCEGRGPELQAVRYANQGKTLVEVEYFNPDDEHIPENLKRLRFIKPQVFMFTPEEVYNVATGIDWAAVNPAAVVSLGRSTWFLAFSQQHLAQCSHFQVVFYDQYLDVICEGIVFESGVAEGTKS